LKQFYSKKENLEQKKKGIFVVIGESFRTGSQTTRVKGLPESVKEQIDACRSHMKFMEHFSDIDWKIVVFSYTTPYDEKIREIYGDKLLHSEFLSEPIGLQNIFQKSLNYIKTSNINYDFVFVSRIDLEFKESFNQVFDPTWNTVHYPFITWFPPEDKKNTHPRVTDTMVFIPKGISFDDLSLSHESWFDYVEKGHKYDELDVMIDTLHDSDSEKDYNPLYTIVNRPATDEWHSLKNKFVKTDYNYI
jgi:hypothetical protein